MKGKTSTIEEIRAARDLKKRERSRKEKQAIDLEHAREELDACLAFQQGHGDRVRAAIMDWDDGVRVVEANSANNRRILELKQIIKNLEKSM